MSEEAVSKRGQENMSKIFCGIEKEDWKCLV